MYSHHEGSVAWKLDQQHITSLCKPPVDWELGFLVGPTSLKLGSICAEFSSFFSSNLFVFPHLTLTSSQIPRRIHLFAPVFPLFNFHLTSILHLNTNLCNQFLFNLTFTVSIILLFYLAPILHLSAPWIQIIPVGNGQIVMKSGTSFAKIERISKQWGKKWLV